LWHCDSASSSPSIGILVATLCCFLFCCVIRRRWRRQDFEKDKRPRPEPISVPHRSAYTDVTYFGHRHRREPPPSTHALVGFQLPEFDGETDDEVTPVGTVRNVLV